MKQASKFHLRLTAKKRKDYAFVAIFLAYPVLQFVFTWAFVNIDSLLLAFKSVSGIDGSESWAGLTNFKIVIDNIFHSKVSHSGIVNDEIIQIINSFGYAIVTCFISMPLSLLFAYFLQKKMPLAGFFRVIFFLPNIIPVVALTMAFRMPFDPINGFLPKVFEKLGVSDVYTSLFSGWPNSQLTVYLYCIWAGLGYNIILYSGAISRIPQEVYESAQLDGAGYGKEFSKIVIPMVGPTTVTLVILGMSNVLTLYLQPYLLMGEQNANIYTVAMSIFTNAADGNEGMYPQLAAKGLLFSLIWAPVILFVRNRLSKRYADLDY